MDKLDEHNLWVTVRTMLTPEDRATMNLRPETDPCMWFLRICDGFNQMREKLIELGYDWEYVDGITQLGGARQLPRLDPAWLPIESAPKDGTWIIGLEPGHCWGIDRDFALTMHWVSSGLFTAGGYWDNVNRFGIANPTHWMPLPEGQYL